MQVGGSLVNLEGHGSHLFTTWSLRVRQKGEGNDKTQVGTMGQAQCRQLQNAQPVQYFPSPTGDENDETGLELGSHWGPKRWAQHGPVIGHVNPAVVQVWEDHPARAQKKWGISDQCTAEKLKAIKIG